MYGFKELEVGDLQGLLQVPADKVSVIDVRTPAEVARGGISGARHIPLHLLPMIEQDLVRECGDRALVFYCQSGGRSAQACAFMASRGHDKVYNLRGGIMAWVQKGHPVASIAP